MLSHQTFSPLFNISEIYLNMAASSSNLVPPNVILVNKLTEFLSSSNLQVCRIDESKGSGGCSAEVQNEVKNCLTGLRRSLEVSSEFKAFVATNASDVTASTTATKTLTIATVAELAKNVGVLFEWKNGEHERFMRLKLEGEMETVKVLKKELNEAKDSFFGEKQIIEQLNREKNELEAQLRHEREVKISETSKWNQEKQMILKKRAKLLQFLETIKQCSNFVENGEVEIEIGDETELVASHVRKMFSKWENEKESILRMNQELEADKNEQQVSTSSWEQASSSTSSLLPPPILELEKSMEEVEQVAGDIIENPVFVLNKTTPRRTTRIRHYKSQRGSLMCICGKKFKTLNILKAHLNLYSNVWKFRCIMCPERFFGLAHLKRHMINSHDISNPLSVYKIGCRMCGEMFRSRARFYMHRSAVHVSKKRQTGNVTDEYEEEQHEAICSDDDYSSSDIDIPILDNEMENK